MTLNIFLKFILLFSSIFFFTSCSQKSTQTTQIQDIKNYEQNPNNYLKFSPKMDYSLQLEEDKVFNKRYFKPWHIKKFPYSQEEVSWGNNYKNKEMYGDNHLLLQDSWYDKQIQNSNFKAYNSLLKKAITVKNTSLRVFPSDSKLFYNPKIAGEGFPFDYNQNSGLKINSPILVSHLSKDKAWAFILSSFTFGWIKVQDLAFTSKSLRDYFENGNYYVAIEDNFAIYKNNIFKSYIKLGTIFPKNKQEKFLIVGQDSKLNAYITTINIPESKVQKKPLKFNQKNIKQVFSQLLNEPYGWGELLNHRDCSALTRDFIAPFGYYLGRNSASQIKDGHYFDLEKLSIKEKKDFILKHAKPYLTLIYLKGHIMLYIGEQNGEPLVFHNVWGIKTKDSNNQESRYVIGRAVVTTLSPGKELYNFNENKAIINKVLGMVNIGH